MARLMTTFRSVYHRRTTANRPSERPAYPPGSPLCLTFADARCVYGKHLQLRDCRGPIWSYRCSQI